MRVPFVVCDCRGRFANQLSDLFHDQLATVRVILYQLYGKHLINVTIFRELDVSERLLSEPVFGELTSTVLIVQWELLPQALSNTIKTADSTDRKCFASWNKDDNEGYQKVKDEESEYVGHVHRSVIR
ncbi:unnamed protein product [Fasciola hepatica]|uniref:Uncharacterized protein n=1 Tax=Fasciola hepatica TaxID=6192 RepID=A0ABC9HHT9_FASHE